MRQNSSYSSLFNTFKNFLKNNNPSINKYYFNSVISMTRITNKNSLLKKLFINFTIFYLIFNFHNKVSNSKTSDNTLICAKEKFWIFGGKSTQGLELDNLEKRAAAVQHNANNPIEDRYSAVELKNFPGYFISVLDGHGGFQCAEFANQRLFNYFDNTYMNLKETKKNLSEDELVINALLKTFEQVEKEFYDISINLYRRGEGKQATVGSCVTISVISMNKIYTAQLGDSKAKLFRKNKENQYDVIKLTTTHNAEKKHQQAELYKQFSDKDIVVCKRPNNTVCYVKGRLQPTRSLGDFHLKHKEFNEFVKGDFKRPITNFNGPYIKSVPEIKIVDITKDDEYIVMATDGLWDFLSSKDVGNVLKQSGSNLKHVANSLFSEVMNKAAEECGMSVEKLMSMPPGKKRNLHDDVTLIVFDLKH